MNPTEVKFTDMQIEEIRVHFKDLWLEKATSGGPKTALTAVMRMLERNGYKIINEPPQEGGNTPQSSPK